MLNTSHNEVEITSASSINSLFGMLSGPHAFREFRLRRTPTASTSESWILESSPIVDFNGNGGVVEDSESLGLKTE